MKSRRQFSGTAATAESELNNTRALNLTNMDVYSFEMAAESILGGALIHPACAEEYAEVEAKLARERKPT